MRHLILYDGLCGVCSGLVGFVLKRDHAGTFGFAPLQGELSRSLLQRFGQPADELSTSYVVVNYWSGPPRLLARSAGVLFMLSALGGPWGWATLLRFLPSWLLDWGYDLVARMRYRWFGRNTTCWIPADDHRSRFVEGDQA